MTEYAYTIVALVAVGAGTGWFVARGARWQLQLLAAMSFATTIIWTVAVFARPSSDLQLTGNLPNVGAVEDLATSNTCRACHPGHYDSWHDSFHRTMTQAATDDAIRAPFDGRVLTERGQAFAVSERDGRYFTLRVDPESGEPLPEARERRIVLTTGSHNMQAYWYLEETGALVQLPFVYYIHEERWLANDDSFLEAPYDEDAPLDRYVWTDGCVECHTTGGPFTPSDLGITMASKVAVGELGIACEQCHGAAGEHVRANQSPARRYALHATDEPDPTIVNPRRLDQARSASVCGRCHTVAEDRSDAPDGLFSPGELLSDYRDIEDLFETQRRNADVHDVGTLDDDDEAETVESFWTSGATRVAGREYDAMARSRCFLEGEMTCITCHVMHGETSGKQLPPVADGAALCGGSCHADIVADPAAHTHHGASSSGSECVNCHMPYSSYGLLSATRSHQLDNPVASGVETRDVPNACNLCHLDRSLRWTAETLSAWYGSPVPELPDAYADVPAGALFMMRGDAVQRAIAAWHLGWDPAREASDTRSLRPGLAVLMVDPYAAVRQIAGRTVLRDEDPEVRGLIDLDALTREPQPALLRELGLESETLESERVRELVRARDGFDVRVPE